FILSHNYTVSASIPSIPICPVNKTSQKTNCFTTFLDAIFQKPLKYQVIMEFWFGVLLFVVLQYSHQSVLQYPLIQLITRELISSNHLCQKSYVVLRNQMLLHKLDFLY